MATHSPNNVQQPLSREAKSLGFFLLACFALVLAGAFAIIAPPSSIRATEGEAQIIFGADRSKIFLSGQCVNATWDVNNIRAVYINGQPTTGSAGQLVCLTAEPETLPTLKVILNDDTPHEYHLNILIVTRSPIFWFLVVLAGLFALGSIVMRLAPRLHRIWMVLRPPVQMVERVVILAAIIGLALELGLRFYLSNFGTEQERVAYLYSAAEIAAKPSRFLPMPYVSYVPSPNFEGHDQLGYRGAGVQIPKPDNVFRIVTLGGSTTYSSSTSADEAYPAQLQKVLRDEYGYASVEVVNGGVPGYTSWDTFVNYALRGVELQPDLLIIYDGINDIEPRAADPDCYRGLNPYRGINPYRGLWQPAPSLSPSTLYRLVGIHFGWVPDPSTVSGSFDYYLRTCSFDDANIKDNPPVYFERNLRSIIAIAHADHTQVLLSSWTYDQTRESPDVPPTWQAAIIEQNELVHDLATEYDLPYYDLAATGLGNTSTFWADPIHMSAAGTLEQAHQYAAYIDEQQLIP
ncbi:MAG: SGNH/GDSL hydrolase family protein [Anaerolineae bacterium]